MEPDAEDRELGSLLRRYEEHRNALRRLSASAPDGRLARRYERFIEDLSRTIDYLVDLQVDEEADDDWEAEEDDADIIAAPPQEQRSRVDDFETMNIKRWNEPLVHDRTQPVPEEPPNRTRSIPMAVILIAIVALISALIWWSAGDEPGEQAAVEESAPPAVIEEAPEPIPMTISPADFDFGAVREGTRASHQFTVTNSSDAPVEIEFERSSCRCLWYQPGPAIPPGQSGEIAITIDGSRVEPGPLTETVVIRNKLNSEMTASVVVTAEIVGRS